MSESFGIPNEHYDWAGAERRMHGLPPEVEQRELDDDSIEFAAPKTRPPTEEEPEFADAGVSASSAEPLWHAERWPVFRDAAPEQQRWIVEGLLPEGMLAFVAAPPKKGKTWIGIGLALAIATGEPLFGEFATPEPRDVLYIALEGSRTGIRTRIGALARGLSLDPDGSDLDRLHMLYRPRPFDLADPNTPGELRRKAERVDAALVVVDVLRAAARFKENVAEEFAQVRDALEPLLAEGRTVALLHHFGKLSETQKERSPGERMAGTGAMYGALDVGLLITRSESGARRLRVEVEARDFAAPEALGVVIGGNGSGEHGGFTYADVATLAIDPTAAEERDLADELEQLFADGAWRVLAELSRKDKGIGANKDDVRAVLEASPHRFVPVEPTRVARHASAKPWGTVAMLRELEEAEEVARASEPPEPPRPSEAEQLQVGAGGSPYGGEPPSHLLSPQHGGGSAEPAHPSHLVDGGDEERLTDDAITDLGLARLGELQERFGDDESGEWRRP